jgi:hypothetical protein
MQIADGSYVIALSRLQFPPDQPILGLVGLYFRRNGLSRELWGVLRPVNAPEDFPASEAIPTDRATT